MMHSTRNRQVAHDLALEHGHFYGKCVHDGVWYTGTEAQLRKIGCTVDVSPLDQSILDDIECAELDL